MLERSIHLDLLGKSITLCLGANFGAESYNINHPPPTPAKKQQHVLQALMDLWTSLLQETHPNSLQTVLLPALVSVLSSLQQSEKQSSQQSVQQSVQQTTQPICIYWPWLMTPFAVKSQKKHVHVLFADKSHDATSAQIHMQCHDKAWAYNEGRALGLDAHLLGRRWYDCCAVLDQPNWEIIVEKVRQAQKLGYPVGVKPRLGSSGRGRISIQTVEHHENHEKNDEDVTDGIRNRAGILAGLQRLGGQGAIIEPWLPRLQDFSTLWYIDPATKQIQFLGITTLLVSDSGIYRGNCGIYNATDDVFLLEDIKIQNELKEKTHKLVEKARDTGFTGFCGIDSFLYSEDNQPVLRSIVEFNARITVGILALFAVRSVYFREYHRAASADKYPADKYPSQKYRWQFTLGIDGATEVVLTPV